MNCMKTLWSVAAGLVATGYSLFADKPNVVVIVSDDAGYADFGFMDAVTGIQTVIPTPNLDALRARGTLFTNAHTGAVCSPSRGAITTGLYQNRVGYEFNTNNLSGADSRDGHFNETVLSFEHMKTVGYTTGAIGKWHVGNAADKDADSGLYGNRPERQGVDEFFGIWQGSRNYPIGNEGDVPALREVHIDENGDVINTKLEKLATLDGSITNHPDPTTFPDTDYNSWVGMNVTNAFGRGGMNFIERHYQSADPFFLYVAFTAPHTPLHNSPDYDDVRIAGLSGNRKKYASMMLTMDKEIGRLMAKLDDPNGDGDNSDSITDETLFFFINDNGGSTHNGDNANTNYPLKGHKGDPYEGGHRVPMLMAGSGIPVNSTFNKIVHSIDITPTIFAAGGGNPLAVDGGFDGVNLIPYLGDTPVESGDPHEYMAVRQGEKFGLREGDWKLVKKSGSTDFELYNLVDDIGETTNLASTYPDKLKELKRAMTELEVQWEKPRHKGITGVSATINQNNKFIANPEAINSIEFTANSTLISGDTLNGNFNEDSSSEDRRTFENTPSWVNVGTGNQTLEATRTNLSASDGSRNAVVGEVAERTHGIDPGHTLSTGEAFKVSYEWYDAFNWNDGNDKIRTSLFVTDTDSIDGVKTVIESLDSNTSSANSSYQSEELIFSAIPAEFNGKKLFVMFNGQDGNGSANGFARLDNFVLQRGTISVSEATSTFNWSESGRWIDADTSNTDKLLIFDSFASAEFEFPSKSYNYKATNEFARMSGMEYMLNKLSFTGSDSASTTVEGTSFIFTNDLDGNAPEIALDRTSGSVALDSDIVLYNNLNITGDGDATFTFNSAISEFNAGLGITKSGSSELLITKNATYTGPTVVNGGTLTVAPSVTLASPVQMAANTTLKGDGTISGTVHVTGVIAPGQSIGTLTFDDSLDLDGTLENEIDGSSTDLLILTNSLDITGSTLKIIDIRSAQSGLSGHYVIAKYGTLTGTFATVTGLPSIVRGKIRTIN